jgi:iron(III) transport system substrate-binding protein
VIASPAASGTSYRPSGLCQLLGKKKPSSGTINLTPTSPSTLNPEAHLPDGCFRRVYRHAFAHDIQVQQDGGLPVTINFPEEGTPFEIGGISILKGTKNLAAAQAWVDYVFSPAFQRYHNDVAHRIPVIEGVELAEGTVGLSDVKLIEGYDHTQWAAQRDALVARWQEEIGANR